MAESFDVVHDRRAHIQTEHRWEIRRFDAWISALAFERFDQAGFFSANVSAGAAMDINLNIEPRAENIFAQEIVFPRFLNRTFENLRSFGKFASNIDIGRARV